MSENQESAEIEVKILPEIGEKPHQPNITFKKSLLFGTQRNFQYKWFSQFKWLHYNEALDKAYCFSCITCIKENLSLKNFSKAIAFTYKGFNLWHKGIERFKLHENSIEHKEAILKIEAKKATPIDEKLLIQREKQRATNRKCFMMLLENIRFLCVRNIAFQGTDKENSNFYTLAELIEKYDSDLQKWIGKERGSYMDHKIQNEILTLMADRLLHEHIMKKIHDADFYTIMCDETTHISNQG